MLANPVIKSIVEAPSGGLHLCVILGWFAGVFVLRPAADHPGVLSLLVFTACVGSFFITFRLTSRPQRSLKLVALMEGDDFLTPTTALPGLARHCKFCPGNPVKPPRTHHCKACGICVARRDHHCHAVGSCIGKGNHVAFFAMMTTQVAASCMYLHMFHHGFGHSLG